MNHKTLSVAAILGAGFAVSLAPVARADSANPFIAAGTGATLVAEHHEHEGEAGEAKGEKLRHRFLRGLMRSGSLVRSGQKIGDVCPTGERARCFTLSDKATAMGRAVLAAIDDVRSCLEES